MISRRLIPWPKMGSQIRVSVVVPTYDRRQALAPVIDGLLASGATNELVVVVDGCRDGSIEYLQERSREDPRVRPLYIENQGEDRARQLGVEHSTGDIVVVIDDDVLVNPGTIEGHAAHHSRYERSVLLGYMPVRLPERRRGEDLYRFHYQASYEKHVELWQQQPETILEHFWGGHFSLRKEDALAVGLGNFDVKITYHSDYHLGLRCKAAGLTGHFDRRLGSEHLFQRNLEAFSRDAYLQGVDRVRLEELRTEVSGAGRSLLEPQSFGQKLLISATVDRRLAVTLERSLQMGVEISGRLGWFEAQAKAARKLQRLNQLRGIRAGLDADLDLGPRIR